MMMCDALGKRQRIAQAGNNCKPRAYATLLIGHPYRAIIDRVSISIRWIQQIKFLPGKIQPAILIKVFSIVFTNGSLKLALPGGYVAMKRFGGGGKIIRRIIALFMKINMYLGQPF